MARLTRSESQTRNRERVVASARRLFLRDGFQATSLAAIAEEAGFSTGVVYSNFTGKTQLAMLVLREIQAEQMDALRTALSGDATVARKLDAAERWAEAALDSGWPRLELEFALDSRADPTVVAQEAHRHESAGELAAVALSGLIPAELLPVVPVRAAAEALLNLCYGVAVRRVIDPSVTAESMIKPLREALRTAGAIR